MTIRSTLNAVSPPDIRTGGATDTTATGTHGSTTVTLAVDSHDRGLLRIDGDGWTVPTSGIVRDLEGIGELHGSVAEQEAALALIQAIAAVYGWTATLSR